jgi:hypothetical protein
MSVGEDHVLTLLTYFESEGYVCDDNARHYIARASDQDHEKILWFERCRERYLGIHVAVHWGLAKLGAAYNCGWVCSYTAGLSLITWNKAYCLFPSATLQCRESRLIDLPTNLTSSRLARLSADGIKTISAAWTQSKASRHCRQMAELRRIGDEQALTVEMNIDGTLRSGKPDSVIESTTFKSCLFDKENDDPETLEPVLHYALDTRSLSYPILRYDYSIWYNDHGCDPSLYTKLCDELVTRLDGLTLMEMAKIRGSERPPQYDQLWRGEIEANTLKGKFALPDTWAFYDGDVIAFLANAWEERDMSG